MFGQWNMVRWLSSLMVCLMYDINYFVHIVQSYCNTYHLCVILDYKPYHVSCNIDVQLKRVITYDSHIL